VVTRVSSYHGRGTGTLRADPGGQDGVPGFQALTLHADQALSDLHALDSLLANKDDLDDARDVLPFFRAHPQLALCLGFFNATMAQYDCLADELPLFGLFRADLVVGDWQRKRYCFVAFADARAQSIFKATARRTSDWAPRFQKGYCQVVDWCWLLEAQEDTAQSEAPKRAEPLGSFRGRALVAAPLASPVTGASCHERMSRSATGTPAVLRAWISVRAAVLMRCGLCSRRAVAGRSPISSSLRLAGW